MTTFEISTIILLAAIVLLLVLRNIQAKKEIEGVTQNQVYNYTELRKIVVGIQEEIGQTNARIDGFIPWAKHLRQKADTLENAWACDITTIIKLLKEIENDMNEHGIAQAKWFDSMSNKLTTIANHTNETTHKVAELVDFEKRNEQRNDEMFARCEEINKLQLAELKAKVHTFDCEPFPPKDVVGVTATGICQECNCRNVCKHYDVNRNKCFVADRKED